MDYQQFLTIFITAIITAGATNLFSYWKEKRITSSKYTERVLVELYIPILKIIKERIEPGFGFEGLNEDQIDELIKILDEKMELLDPELEGIIYSYKETQYHNWQGANYHYEKEDERLLAYMLYAFNKTRKSLGLPYENKYVYSRVTKILSWISINKLIKAMKKF